MVMRPGLSYTLVSRGERRVSEKRELVQSVKVRIQSHLEISGVYASPKTSGRLLEELLEEISKSQK